MEMIKPGLDTDEDETESYKNECGWFTYRPRFLQRCLTPQVFLFCVCIGSAMQGFIVNGLINVSITSLERRFDLSSARSGLIASTYDIAAILFSIPIGYFGGRASASKPRWIGLGLMVMGTGSFVFSLPHFLSGLYDGANKNESAVCVRNTSFLSPSQRSDACDSTSTSDLDGQSDVSHFLYVFLVAQLLHGFGAAPLWSLVVTFIETNVKKQLVSLYLAIYYATALVGPSIGYLGGSLMLRIHTDMGAVDVEKLKLTPDSQQWVGVWWLGFVVAGFLTWLAALPILAFPSRLPSSLELVTDTSEMHGGASQEKLASVDTKLEKANIKDLPLAVWQCLTNPSFLCMSLGGGTNGAVLAGISTYMPKIMENQLSLSASLAGMYTGAAALSGGVLGSLTGGYVVKRYNMSCGTMMRLVAASTFFALACSLIFVLSCPDVKLVGLNIDYPSQPDRSAGALQLFSGTSTEHNLVDSCNTNCQCSGHSYMPICDQHGLTYYSPCHAGCTNQTDQGYTNCSCASTHPSTVSPHATGVMVEGRCSTQCTYLPLMASVMIATAFAIFLGSAPSSTATVRLVTPGQRSLALGITMTVLRLVGTIPGPLIYGALLDRSCVLWKGCRSTGSCLLYNNWWMNRYVLIATSCSLALSCLFFNLAWILYKPSNTSQTSTESSNGVTENTLDGVPSAAVTSAQGQRNDGFLMDSR